MARPSIIDEALIAKFCSHLRISGSIKTAISATGIARESYYGWARKVRQGGGTELERKFIVAVDQAEGETKLIHEHMLSKHFDKKWRAIAWWLERRYPAEYGRRRLPPLSDLDDPDEQAWPTRVFLQKAPSAPRVKVEPMRADAKPATVPEDGLPEAVERVSGAWVTGTYYETLGLEPITGRFLRTDDDRPDAQPVAVITDGYWARRLGRDRKVIGQSLRIEGVPVTIVGVSPSEFNSPPGGQLAEITMAVGVRPQVQLTILEVILPPGLCSPLRIVA
jgi:hypothetical protein